MNGLEDDGVASTIHITPEDHCSYASLEISGPKQASSMAVHAQDASFAVRGAAGIFHPKHMAVAVSWAGDEGFSGANTHSSLTGKPSLTPSITKAPHWMGNLPYTHCWDMQLHVVIPFAFSCGFRHAPYVSAPCACPCDDWFMDLAAA